MFLNVFERVRMQSDAFGCVGVRSDTSGNSVIFLCFRTTLIIFGHFWTLGAYFYGYFMFRSLTFWIANYSEAALEKQRSLIQNKGNDCRSAVDCVL